MSSERRSAGGAAAAAIEAELHRIEGGRELFSPGFPVGLAPLCDPALILEDGAAEPGAAFSLLRASWVAGAPMLLAARGRLEPQGGSEAWRVTALALPDPAATMTPELAAALPGLLDAIEKKTAGAARLGPEPVAPPAVRGAPSARDAAEKAAGRAVAAAASPLAGASVALEAADEAAFWKAVAAFLQATPPALRPAISALYSPDAAGRGFLLTFARPGEAPVPPAEAVEAGRLWLGGEPGGALSAPIEDADALAMLGRRFAALSPSPELAALAAFLTALDAPLALPESAAGLEAALGALEEGRCAVPGGLDDAVLDDLGQARAAGLVAAATPAALWETVARRAPERAYWRALDLTAPAEAAPIPSLEALGRLAALEAVLRRAAPEGATTPFDAPLLEARFAAFAAAAPRMLILGPTALTEPLAEPLGAALAAAIESRRLALPALAHALDALDLAARQGPRAIGAPALATLSAAAAALRERSGLAQNRRYAAPPLPLDNPVTVKQFAAHWLAALEQGAHRAAAFWRDRFEAWIAAAGHAEDREGALAGAAAMAQDRGPAGRHLARAIVALGGPSLEAAAAEPDAAAEEESAEQAPAARAPRKPAAPALGAGAKLQDVFAALRAEEAAAEESPAPPPAPAAEASRGAAPDATTLDAQAAAIAEWRREFETERTRRAEGAPAQPIRLAYGDRKSFAALADALAETVLAQPEAAAAAFGADVGWTLRQLAGIGLPPAARPGFEPAPESLRGAFARLGDRDVQEEAAGPELFPLHLAGKLLQAQRERALSVNRLTDGFVDALAGASVPKMIGAQSVTYNKGALGAYLWLRKRAGTPDFADLPDEGVAERLDVALLALTLISAGPPAGAEALIEPIEAPEDLRTLTPPKEAIDRLEAFLSAPGGPFSAQKKAFASLMGSRQLYGNAALSQLWRRMPR